MTAGARQGNSAWMRSAWLAVVAVLLLAGLGVLPQRARAASYPCTEAGLNNAIATGGSATFACTGPSNFGITSTKTISRDLTLDGGGLLTISGANTYQVFSVNSGITFSVQNLTISNGRNTSGNGSGGAIANNGGKVTVMNSTLSGNSAVAFGAGIYNANNGALTVTGSVLNGNTILAGGSGGGGIYTANGTIVVANSTFTNNSASLGGGIDVYSGTVTVLNSTLTGNGSGGGIYNGGTLNLTNTLLVNNGIDLSGSALSVNSHNRTGSFTFADSNSNIPGNHGGPTPTFALPLDSPAIDAGVCNPTYTDPTTTTTVMVTTDQRGVSRPQGNGCDIGAFESQGASVRSVAGNGQTAPVTTAFAAPLRVTATALDPGVSGSGAPLTFTALASGASGTFAGGVSTATATTDSNGNATSPVFTANTVAGNYTVFAGMTSGAGGAATFTLANTAGGAASISVVSGSNQSAPIGSVFTAPLQVQVRDQYTNLVPGATVAFTAPTGNVATATLTGATAVTNGSGIAGVTATAAGRPGVFTATATVNGVSTSFTLTNTADPATTVTLTGFSPPTGPTGGGNSITLTGANLTAASTVTVGGTNAPIVPNTNTATSITVTAPAHAAGTVDISVTANGQTATIHGYTYVDSGNIVPQPVQHPLPGSGSGGGGPAPVPAPARHEDAGSGGARPQAAPAGGVTATAPVTPNAQPRRH